MFTIDYLLVIWNELVKVKKIFILISTMVNAGSSNL